MWIDRRILVGITGASLLLNVALIGFATDRLFAGTRQGPSRGGLVPRNHLASISPTDREHFKAAIAARRPAIRAARDAHRAARATVVRDLAAPTFDRGQVMADLASLRRAGTAVQEAVQGALVDAMADLPAAARSKLVADDAGDPKQAR